MNEYDLLQKQLTSKLEKAPYDYPNSKYKEGYKQGLLAAKSIVSQFYKNLYKVKIDTQDIVTVVVNM